MKKRSKKGFTIIEIIVVIGILAFIGTISIFGIRLINKNIKISKLEQITERVVKAAEVYIETNKETQNQLYTKKNSVIIPLNTLINEGLMDLKGTTLEDKDIENEYVVTAFTKDSQKENCIDITTSTSWNLSKDNPFYICSNESGSQNSIIIGGTTRNIDTVKVQTDYVTNKNGVYTFNGGDNYIIKKGVDNKKYRLILVDRDDSLVIGTTDSSFNGAFDGKTQKYVTTTLNQASAPATTANSSSYYKWSSWSDDNKIYTNSSCTTLLKEGDVELYVGYANSCPSGEAITITLDKEIKNGEVPLFVDDLKSFGKTIKDLSIENYYTGTLYYKRERYGRVQCEYFSNCNGRSSQYFTIYEHGTLSYGKKIKLKSCMKITGGTGSEVNPYEISDLC